MRALFALAAVAVIPVLLLSPAALFPETTHEVVDELLTPFVDRPRLVSDLRESLEWAKKGDTDQQYVFALYHLYEGDSRRDEIFEDVLGLRDREKGERS